MKRLIIVPLVIAIFVLSCCQNNHINITSNLGSMFCDIPDELAANNLLWFSDMERIKKLAGLNPDTNAKEYLQFLKTITDQTEYQRQMALLAGYVPSEFSGGSHLEYWEDTFGYDAFNLNQEIMIHSLSQPNTSQPLFSVMKGNFDANRIIEKLSGLGYQQKNYASIDYYSIRDDYQVDFGSSPARMSMAFLNRMLVNDREIIAAPADDIFFSVLNVRKGEQSSLENSLAYTSVSEALGDILGAALIPRSQLICEYVNEDWNKLHEYELIGIGYYFDEGHGLPSLYITIYYPDDSAEKDIDEFKRRLNEYEMTMDDLSGQLLTDLFDTGNPEVIDCETGSILRTELTYKPDTIHSIWTALIATCDLGFLVINPAGSE